MYIIKNALKSISRSKGRNFLIVIIVFVIATSSCIGLSIRQASENAKANTLEGMNITANISFDRQSMMNEMKPEDGKENEFDRDSFKDKMNQTSSLTLEEYLTYSTSENVKDFYYTLTASFNGSDTLEPVSTDTDSENNSSMGGFNNFPGNMGGFGGMDKGQMNRVSSDFTIVGYSSENAMSDFIDGNTSITSGTVFEENTTNLDCIISDELATYNNLEVNDTITITNPNNEEEMYELTIVGIYSSNSSSENFFSDMGMKSSDPANQIYMSYEGLNTILETSKENETIETDSNGREISSIINGTLKATYVFDNVDSYELFSEEIYELGLDESYIVSSSDITSFENSLVPLETLSTMAGYFLVVILIIGAIILVVLNIFNIRERKYEVGVLCAIGMKKWKVACQFLVEIFVVTMLAVTLGIGVGAVSSVPVTNALLENQVTSQSNQMNQIEQNFGRPGDMQGKPNDMSNNMQNKPQDIFNDFMSHTADYVTEIDNAMNFTVVCQMFGIALLLTLVSGAVSVLFVMRYEPLKILANRD